jgi:hypothetical protein
MVDSTGEWFRLMSLQFVPQVPVYLVWLVGMLLALTRWRRHPIPSLLALIAFTLFLMSAISGTLLSNWAILGDHPNLERGWLLSAISLVRTGISTVAWILLLLALFGWRTPPPPRRILRSEPIDDVLPAAPDLGIRKDRPE